MLHVRDKTLPTNGVEFHLESESRRNDGDPYARDIMQKVLLKELLYQSERENLGFRTRG